MNTPTKSKVFALGLAALFGAGLWGRPGGRPFTAST
jgi:hypothetical protein